MTRPVVHETAERLYKRLPLFYQSTDEEQTNADGSETEYYPLLRFISGICSELGAINDLIMRFDYANNGVTSDLVDPLTANDEWMPWLAALTGVKDAGTETGVVETASFQQILDAADTNNDSVTTWSELYALDAGTGVAWEVLQDINSGSRTQFLGTRALIKNRETYGFDDGTRDSVARVVKSVLTGSNPYCFVGSRAEAVAVGLATTPTESSSDLSLPWRVYIVVLQSEAPSTLTTGSALLADLLEPVKAAGLVYSLVYKAP